MAKAAQHIEQHQVGHDDAHFTIAQPLGQPVDRRMRRIGEEVDPDAGISDEHGVSWVFTAVMLFLPSGLGVYMFTNSILGIVQQLAVEKYYASQEAAKASGDVVVRDVTNDDDENGKKKSGSALGKGDARV